MSRIGKNAHISVFYLRGVTFKGTQQLLINKDFLKKLKKKEISAFIAGFRNIFFRFPPKNFVFRKNFFDLNVYEFNGEEFFFFFENFK